MLHLPLSCYLHCRSYKGTDTKRTSATRYCARKETEHTELWFTWTPVYWTEASAHPHFSEIGQNDWILAKAFLYSKSNANLASKL